MEIKKEVRSAQEFEEKYFPERRKKTESKASSPYEFGAFLANQAMDKYRLTSKN